MNFNTLSEPSDVHTGDAVVCGNKSCAAILSHFSVLADQKDEEEKVRSGTSWASLLVITEHMTSNMQDLTLEVQAQFYAMWKLSAISKCGNHWKWAQKMILGKGAHLFLFSTSAATVVKIGVCSTRRRSTISFHSCKSIMDGCTCVLL